MKETQTKLKLTWWPTPQDYNEAIQITRGNLQDPQLQQGLVYTDALGLPRPITGSFASVYRLHCKDKDFALRLFLRNISDQEERYALISDFVQHDELPYTVTFDFLKSGIKVMGEWLPALKMEWVDGPSFDDYIVANVANSDKLKRLNEKFVTMMDELRKAGIAHGDLQHGNIIVWQDELRLVDYDGMFVPAMHGSEANELGHRNYQHPARAAKHFGPYLDNFSAWVIYASVKALQIDSRLLHQLGGGDDCLLFRQTDFLDPLHSAAFAAFERHEDEELNKLGRFIRAQLKKDADDVPYLQLPVPLVSESDLGAEIGKETPTLRSGPRLIRGPLPDWLEDSNQTALSGSNIGNTTSHVLSSSNAPPPSNTSIPRLSHYQSWAVPANPAAGAQWTKPASVINPLPAELQTNSGREVKYNRSCGKPSPVLWQKLMIFACFSIFFAFVFSAPDNEGVHNPTTHRESTTSGSTPSRISNANAARVLAEALDSHPKTIKQDEQDEKSAALLLCFCLLFLEAVIWIPALRDRDLAKNGMPVIATVLERNQIADPVSHMHQVVVSYSVSGEQKVKAVPVSHQQLSSFSPGGTEIILCNSANPEDFVLYRLCRYRAVLTPQPVASQARP